MRVSFTYTPHPGETRYVDIDVEDFSVTFDNFIVSVDRKELKVFSRIYSERMQQGYTNAPFVVLPNVRIEEVEGRFVSCEGATKG